MFFRLLLLFTVVPLVELFLLVKLGTFIGLWPTIGIVIGTGVLGAWLTRLQGLRTLRAVSGDLAEGKVPTGHLIDGLLILLAGAVLLTPGLLTDACGFFLLVPPGRAVVRGVLARAIADRVKPGQPVTLDASWTHED